MVNKILNISLVTKMLKNRPLFIFRPKMSIYKRNSCKTRCMCFLIKDEKCLQKYNEICEKVSNIIKKNLIVNLYIIKNI